MSKQLSIISAGASAAILESAAAIVKKVTGGKVSTTTATTADRHAVVVGPETPAGIHTVVTAVPAAPFPAYAGVKTVVVRAVLPRSAPDRVQLRDALDVFPAAGISTEAEERAAAESFRRSAAVAVARARAVNASRVTLVVKQASRYTGVNGVFRRVCEEVVAAAGLSVEVQGTAAATNELVLRPESLGVVLLNDVPATEHVELAAAGIFGGAYRTCHTNTGGSVSAGHSFKSVALAVAAELRALGMQAEAERVEAAAAKNPRAVVAAL
ncbi:uncharacterized protein TM35_000161390 [Trypanosoma theileri]|uniref:Uncharacterized protein n=1 Tax=Trypanosoma theileri TaxID=67003 RepID=A0A1X0NV63_9TRYP|nr:uncharacterized protein TM35_000161390 [Trypanosoma theileri]ORC88501.1 hypothetical protein TM35_000161390 [Trypanosoma theileri]